MSRHRNGFLLFCVLMLYVVPETLSNCNGPNKYPKLPCLKKTFKIMDVHPKDCKLNINEFKGIFYDKYNHGQYVRRETFIEAVKYKSFMSCGLDASKMFSAIAGETGYTDNIPISTFIQCFDQDGDGSITGVDFTYKYHKMLLSINSMRLGGFM